MENPIPTYKCPECGRWTSAEKNYSFIYEDGVDTWPSGVYCDRECLVKIAVRFPEIEI